MALRIVIKANTLHVGQEQIKSILFVSQNSHQDIRLTVIPTFTGPFTVDGLSITINDIFGFFRLNHRFPCYANDQFHLVKFGSYRQEILLLLIDY